MKHHPILLSTTLILLLAGSSVFGQRTDYFTIEDRAVVEPTEIDEHWGGYVKNLEAPFPGSGSYRGFLQEQKTHIAPGTSPIRSTAAAKVQSPMPIVQSSFTGNRVGGIPCDNDVAVSNGGHLISVVNSSILAIDLITDSVVLDISLGDFAAPLGLAGNKYDPKVTYDPSSNRFIIVFLNATNSATNRIVVAFSSSADPRDAWNLYSIPGNPMANNTWSDYPIIAMTDLELFITVNLIQDNSSWQTGFRESLIWQVSKANGYIGAPLQSVLRSGITFNGKPIRNLCPIQGGSSTGGPEIYLLSNRNFDMLNDTIFFLQVTGILQDTTTSVTLDVLQSSQPYGLAPSADQPGGLNLQTNDSRVLGGFVQDGELHFVGNSGYDNGTEVQAAVYHGRITNLTTNPTVEGWILQDAELEFGYPNISFAGFGPGDLRAIISYNHSSADSMPGISATSWTTLEGHSTRLHITSGTNYVDLIGGSDQRWGDYSGSQPKYDEPGKVWISGFTGHNGGPLQPNTNKAWIAELANPAPTGTATLEDRHSDMVAYPNPTHREIFLQFELEQSVVADISIYSAEGRKVKRLLRDSIKKGRNLLSFSTQPLTAGVYFVVVESDEGQLFRERIVVQ